MKENNTLTNGREKKSTEQDKLQRLWEDLQDLSEVQDQSRNEQRPVGFNDDDHEIEYGNISRRSEGSSFTNTNQILSDSFNCNQGHETQNSRNYNQEKYEDMAKGNFAKKIETFYPQTAKYQNPTTITSTNTYNYSQFSPFTQGNKPTVSYNAQYEQQSPNQSYSHSQQNISRQSNSQSQLQDQSQSLQQVNERLLSDNKKLFDECIKLRKALLIYQKKEQANTKDKEKRQSQAEEKMMKQKEDKINKLLIRVSELTVQNSSLKSKISDSQMKFTTQKQELTSNFTKIKTQLQYDLQSKHRKELNSFECLLSEKEKQLTELRQTMKEQLINLAKSRKELQVQKGHRQKIQISLKKFQKEVENLKNQLLQSKVQKLNIVNSPRHQNSTSTPYEKDSRANSIKSTSISASLNTSFNNNIIEKNDKSYCYSLNEKPLSINPLEATLKDKERQITNMKVVHEAEIKNYKQLIKQLELQLQILK